MARSRSDLPGAAATMLRSEAEDNIMGGRNAMDMADAVERGEVESAVALHWHLVHNHYPPLPAALAETARAAIVAAREGEMDRQIPLPVGMLFRGRRAMTASEAVQSLHLEAFVG